MFLSLKKFKKTLSLRLITGFLAMAFVWSLPFSVPAQSQVAPVFMPPMIKGITINPQNPLQFDFLIDVGNTDFSTKPQEERSDEYQKLIRYFLAALTVPEKNMWVNLSPYEKDRMIPDDFGKTEMGRDLLSQDYILKQITASILNPQKDLGQKFWERVYAEAKEKFGTTNIPVKTFNKVWIVPDRASVYEKENSVFLIESHLKVMLEEDYLALQKADVKAADAKDVNALGSQIVREIIIPAIEKEVNEGKDFAILRQINNSLILATWYKTALKESLLGKIYVDRAKTAGVDQEDISENQRIYENYFEAFKKGANNFIKEEIDPATQELIPRKYFSGGYTTTLASTPLSDRIDRLPAGAKVQESLADSAALESVSVTLVEAAPITRNFREYSVDELKDNYDRNMVRARALRDETSFVVAQVNEGFERLEQVLFSDQPGEIAISERPQEVLEYVQKTIEDLALKRKQIRSSILGTISSYLQFYIVKTEKTQQGLADEAGLSDSYFGHIVKNTSKSFPTQETRNKIAAVLNGYDSTITYEGTLTPLRPAELAVEEAYARGKRIYVRLFALALDSYRMQAISFATRSYFSTLFRGLTEYISLDSIQEKTLAFKELRGDQPLKPAVRSRLEERLLEKQKKLQVAVGAELKALRQKRGLSLMELVRLPELGIGPDGSDQNNFRIQLGLIEEGQYASLPSERIVRVARVLGLDIARIDQLNPVVEKLLQEIEGLEKQVSLSYSDAARNFDRLMRERNISDRTLARNMGISYSVISLWRNQKERIGIKYLPDIAAQLKVSPQDLWGELNDLQFFKFAEESGQRLVTASSSLTDLDRRGFLRAAGAGAVAALSGLRGDTLRANSQLQFIEKGQGYLSLEFLIRHFNALLRTTSANILPLYVSHTDTHDFKEVEPVFDAIFKTAKQQARRVVVVLERDRVSDYRLIDSDLALAIMRAQRSGKSVDSLLLEKLDREIHNIDARFRDNYLKALRESRPEDVQILLSQILGESEVAFETAQFVFLKNALAQNAADIEIFFERKGRESALQQIQNVSEQLKEEKIDVLAERNTERIKAFWRENADRGSFSDVPRTIRDRDTSLTRDIQQYTRDYPNSFVVNVRGKGHFIGLRGMFEDKGLSTMPFIPFRELGEAARMSVFTQERNLPREAEFAGFEQPQEGQGFSLKEASVLVSKEQNVLKHIFNLTSKDKQFLRTLVPYQKNVAVDQNAFNIYYTKVVREFLNAMVASLGLSKEEALRAYYEAGGIRNVVYSAMIHVYGGMMFSSGVENYMVAFIRTEFTKKFSDQYMMGEITMTLSLAKHLSRLLITRGLAAQSDRALWNSTIEQMTETAMQSSVLEGVESEIVRMEIDGTARRLVSQMQTLLLVFENSSGSLEEVASSAIASWAEYSQIPQENLNRETIEKRFLELENILPLDKAALGQDLQRLIAVDRQPLELLKEVVFYLDVLDSRRVQLQNQIAQKGKIDDAERRALESERDAMIDEYSRGKKVFTMILSLAIQWYQVNSWDIEKTMGEKGAHLDLLTRARNELVSLASMAQIVQAVEKLKSVEPKPVVVSLLQRKLDLLHRKNTQPIGQRIRALIEKSGSRMSEVYSPSDAQKLSQLSSGNGFTRNPEIFNRLLAPANMNWDQFLTDNEDIKQNLVEETYYENELIRSTQNLAQRLVALRGQRTRGDVVKGTTISPQLLNQYEQGKIKRVNPRHLPIFAAQLEVSVSQIWPAEDLITFDFASGGNASSAITNQTKQFAAGLALAAGSLFMHAPAGAAEFSFESVTIPTRTESGDSFEKLTRQIFFEKHFLHRIDPATKERLLAEALEVLRNENPGQDIPANIRDNFTPGQTLRVQNTIDYLGIAVLRFYSTLFYQQDIEVSGSKRTIYYVIPKAGENPFTKSTVGRAFGKQGIVINLSAAAPYFKSLKSFMSVVGALLPQNRAEMYGYRAGLSDEDNLNLIFSNFLSHEVGHLIMLDKPDLRMKTDAIGTQKILSGPKSIFVEQEAWAFLFEVQNSIYPRGVMGSLLSFALEVDDKSEETAHVLASRIVVWNILNQLGYGDFLANRKIAEAKDSRGGNLSPQEESDIRKSAVLSWVMSPESETNARNLELEEFLVSKTPQRLREAATQTFESLSGLKLPQMPSNFEPPKNVLSKVLSLAASSGVETLKEEEFTKGGIDLNTRNLNLKIKRDTKGVPLPLPMQNIEAIEIQGFSPEILEITPVSNPLQMIGQEKIY